MRLDKYLKVSRLIKRRTLANEFCRLGKVLLDGRTAKASTEVKVGNALQLSFLNRILTIMITDVPLRGNLPKESKLYEVISDVKVDDSF